MLVEERAKQRAEELDVGRETDLWLLAARQYLHDMTTTVKVFRH
jgi:hypothetical protein